MAESKCPIHSANAAGGGQQLSHWWPNDIPVHILRQNSSLSNPYGKDFAYAEALKTLDYPALKADVKKLFTENQDFWPADHGQFVFHIPLTLIYANEPVFLAHSIYD
jgi:catalase-peroxidase